MKNLVKSVLTLSISSALAISAAQAATYKIIDKGAADKFKFTYAQQENNLGQMAVSGTDSYNFPLQFQYFDEADFDAIVLAAGRNHELVNGINDIEDEEALRAGNPTANDLFWAVYYIRDVRSSSIYYQKYGDIVAMTNFGDESTEFTVYDQKFEGTDTYTRSTVDYINGINDQGWVYGNGSAPFLPVKFTPSGGDEVTLWLSEFTTRGFLTVDRGETIVPIMPPEATYGGESAVLDINENGVAVGYASTSIVEEIKEVIEDETGGCRDPKVLEDLPFEACVQLRANGMYNNEAFKWIIDENGVISTEALGFLVTPNVDDKRQHVSVAQAVNNHGVVVGYATGWWDETETEPSRNERSSTYAVVFKDGEVKDFTEDHSKHFRSRAYDINDKGIAVGHAETVSNGSVRKKFYYVDTNAENPQMVLPTDFFVGSSSSARAINEHGIIVGQGEVETHNDNSSPRRTHGFMYDINTDTFTDLNDLLPCDSKYTVIEVRDINENNEISGTAVLKVERRDAKGQIMKDADGKALTEDVVRAIKMSPLGSGEPEDCSEVVDKVERKGASLGLFSLSILTLFGFTRRFKLKK
ncbi:DUF3466 family protein [Thalassotalea marina]|uniref:DUF3466 family protein n=1 Tax=Thalassotalea marina TaxID=1673741 RepID=A0A919EKK9_9GAMM|nr:DUF3466 family protein [Thalassotalea marina]GHF92453.1 hypothetical protein GCM10017161_20730 [Thalassotalea marina]